MGAAGRVRAEAYAWPRVIGAYEELWVELAERRAAAGPVEGFEPSVAPDPFGAFAGFATPGGGRGLRIELVAGLDPMAELKRVAALPKAVVDPRLSRDSLALLDLMARSGPLTVATGQPGEHLRTQRAGLRAAFWLARAGILRITPL